MKNRSVFILLFLISAFWNCKVFGQNGNRFDFERIEDNSFLIEEAYNQEPGVIQHISAFQYMQDHSWLYTFTEEWPVPGRKHQLSATIPVMKSGQTGFGDILLNYRYQAFLRERFAFSPRFSIMLPTGSHSKNLAAGVPGYQLSLPVSYLLSTKIVTHYNLGLTFTPGIRNTDGTRFNQTVFTWGLSTILLLSKTFNFMLEAVASTTTMRGENSKVTTSNSFLINPGFRYAINFRSGLQIVPGLAIPVGLGPSGGEHGLFAYLSFEHPLWKPR